MTTKKELENIAGKINNVLESRKLNREVTVEYAYGQPRVYLYRKCDQALLQELSPRMSKSQLECWMSAFYDGLTLFPRTLSCYECGKELTDYSDIAHIEKDLMVCMNCFDRTILKLDDENQIL